MTEPYTITQNAIEKYAAYLRREERASGTIESYLRNISSFSNWVCGEAITQERVNGWKSYLAEQGYASVTINTMLAALNSFFRFLSWPLKAKFLKIQRRLFRTPERELTRAEYERLLTTARAQGKEQLALLMETICATGIRVSEVQYITVQAAEEGRTEIRLKGKIRTILLPGKLCRKLLKFAKTQKTASGQIFRTKSGMPLGRRQIWAQLKALCRAAHVEAEKVFPHNLRHLFATVFYKAYRDIARLADLLGHSSIDTTRIYLAVSGDECRRRLDRLALVV